MKTKFKIRFNVSERKFILRFVDIAVIFIALHTAHIFTNFNYFIFSVNYFYWGILLAFYILFFGTIFEMYNLKIARNTSLIVKSVVFTVSSTILSYLLTPILAPQLPYNRTQLLAFYFIVFISLLAWRLFYAFFLVTHHFQEKALLICHQEKMHDLILKLECADPNYKIVAHLNIGEQNTNPLNAKHIENVNIDSFINFVKENAISEIIIASKKTEKITLKLYQKLLHLLQEGSNIREYSQVYESKNERISLSYIKKNWNHFLSFSKNNTNNLYLTFVRVIEIIVSIFGILIGILLLPFILIGNALGNKGPLFYTQSRVGKNAVNFKIYKLRSMVTNAESNGAVFATKNDARITSFGNFLRRSRLDEIPQFINILKGDMSLIGPRPERSVFVDKITQTMPFYQTRHVIKPGVTGWAQVNYSYGETIKDSLIKLQYDLYYIKHRSFYLDLKIILKTITTVLYYRGQ